MGPSAFGQFEGADFENPFYTGILGGAIILFFRVSGLVFAYMNVIDKKQFKWK